MASLNTLLDLAEQQVGYQEKNQPGCWMIYVPMPDTTIIQNTQET